jgi:ribulose-5-phosphate 4-epimerase/fuculose-1-phosphate aldolase
MSEGFVKYTAQHTMGPAIESPHWAKMNDARSHLYKLGLIGVNSGGIGFGNVSIRVHDDEFLITGTATGKLPELTLNEYCLVKSFDLIENRVVSAGPAQASSESMTHGAVYESCSGANCIIHIHSRAIFDGMIREGHPATPANAEFGTPEIALAIANCVKEIGQDEGAIVLAGHDEGVVIYGPSVEKALAIVQDLYTKYGG